MFILINMSRHLLCLVINFVVSNYFLYSYLYYVIQRGVCFFVVCPLQGKFVRIHFGTNGKIAGADIESCKSNLNNKTKLTMNILEY